MRLKIIEIEKALFRRKKGLRKKKYE